jgi:predicted ATP-grasp superfamily ATP-dependent carboligase
MNKLSVLVLEGEYRLTAAVLFCLSQQSNVVIHVITRAADSPFRLSRYVQSHHRCAAPKSDAEFIAFAREVTAATQVQVFLPIDVRGMRFLIAHRQELETFIHPLPLPSSSAYEIAADKSRLAAFMRQHNIPGPDTILDITLDHLAERLDGLRFPVLLKPTEGAGGQGITLFEEPAALLKNMATLSADCKYIVQTYLEGYDIDCNVLCKNGKILAHSVQKGLLPASSEYAPTLAIEFVRSEAVLEVVARLMAALNWNGVAHLDLRYDARAQQINVIEINPRFWLTVVGSALTAKINFPVLACEAALDHPIAPSTFALGRFIPFANFLKYKYSHHEADKIPFGLRDTSVMGFLGDPMPKLYYLLNRSKVHLE